jgi:hypothetical protein
VSHTVTDTACTITGAHNEYPDRWYAYEHAFPKTKANVKNMGSRNTVLAPA